MSSSTSSACSSTSSAETSNDEEEEAEQGSSLEGNDEADDESPPIVERYFVSSARSGMENVIRHQERGIEINQQGSLHGSLLQNASMAELHQALREYRHQQLSRHADGQERNRGFTPRRDNEHIRTTIQVIDQALEVVRSLQEENNTDDDEQEIGNSSSAFSSATSQDNRRTTSRRDNEHMRELIRTIDQALGVARTHQGEEEEEASADDDQEEGADAAAADDDV